MTLDVKRLILLAALALSACSVTGSGEIQCADDTSCPSDYPVCQSGKCVSGVLAVIAGVEGHSSTDVLHKSIRIDVRARAAGGVKSVSLAAGGKTFPVSASNPPLYFFDVDTAQLSDGTVSFTATVNANSGGVGTASSPLQIDNTAPVLTAPATLPAAQAGTLVTLDVTASKPLATLAADVLSGTSVVGHPTEISAPTGNVHHLGFAVVNGMAAGTYTISVTASDAAGNLTASPLTRQFDVLPLPAITSFAGPQIVTTGTGPSFNAQYTPANATASVDHGCSGGPTSFSCLPMTSTTTYTLTVQLGSASVQATQTVQVAPDPNSSAISFVGPAINPGAQANFGGTGCAGCTVTFNPVLTLDSGTTTGAFTAHLTANPTVATTVSMSVTNAAGASALKTATAIVTQPAIASFSGPAYATSGGAPPILVAQFTPSTATASVAGCTGGAVSGTGPFQQKFTCSSITADTTYSLNVMLGTATATASATVAVAADPAVQLSLTASPPVLPFASSNATKLTATFCGGSNLCSAAYTANGGLPAGITSGLTTAALGQSATTSYTLVVTNTASSTASAEITVPLYTSTFATNTMASARQGAAVALLGNGKVLVAGGSSANTAASGLDTAEIFDPSTGTWTSVACSCAPTCTGGGAPVQAKLHSARFQATATLLQNGTVLIPGGTDTTGTALTSVDVYDPLADCFRSNANPLNTARAGHTATVYGTNVAVIGGGVASCEIFSQGTGITNGAFTACGGTIGPTGNKDMQTARANHIAVLLANRYVLVAGGATADTTADIFDTNTGGVGGFTTHLATNTMRAARTQATATLLANGKVLIAGGGPASAELFTFNAGTPSSSTSVNAGNSMSVSRTGHAAILLNGGGVLLAGGNASTTVDVYDPIANQFGSSFALSTARAGPTFGVPLLIGGRALVGGGTSTATAADYIVP